ncbi:MAG: type IV pilus assembly protein PilM [Candidatus Blackburnbacteria bacterium]|nr:type IV pilus assembly protein PilM [Candidatus Blackburnbacteria bacterium]
MLGLDIGLKSIKAVELEPQGDKFTLVAAGVTGTPPNGLSDLEQDLAATGAAVKKLIGDAKITVREANISLPESSVFTRLIELPDLTDEEISSAVSWQAESYIPIPVEEANIDYQIVNRRSPQGGQQGAVEVLLVAAPKALVDKYVRVAALSGLAIAGVETELIALSRAIAPQNQTVLVVDLGGSSTNLAVVKNGQVMFSRSVPTGGMAFARAVAKGLSVSLEQAEEYKKAYGLAKKQLEGKVRAALEPPLGIIAEEMKKAIQYYKGELKKEDAVNEAILSGGAVGMPELATFLAEQLGIEIRIGDPFANIIKDERLTNAFTAYAPLYGVAIGLAEKG